MNQTNSGRTNDYPVDQNNNLFVIKIGGNVIDDPSSLSSFLSDFSGIPGKKILVHGGGKIATSIGNKLGIEAKYIDGRRITNDDTIDIVTMVYGGLVNKKIVASLQGMNCNAIGLTGADANVMPATRRPVGKIDYGWAGDITTGNIDANLWYLFLENGMVPIVAPLTHDGAGHILNTNADTMAAALSVSLTSRYEVKLVYCFEKSGVLKNVNDESSVIANLHEKDYLQLKRSNQLFAGILPKIDNSFDAIRGGTKEVIIGNSASLLQLLNGKNGTIISA